MKFNDKTKEIFISQYDWGVPIVFTAKNGFVDGDKIIFTFDNENILNKEYIVELSDNEFEFSLTFTQAEAESILAIAKLDSCFTIRYSVKHKREGEDGFVDTLINSKLVVNPSVPIESKRNYLVELENENRALREALDRIAVDIALPAVEFFDYDGTVVHSYPERYVYTMQDLPEPPIHSGLRFLGWNWTLEQIKSTVAQYPGKCVNVGALYSTVDGKTRIYIQLDEGETDFTLRVKQTQPDIVSVDWGDGSQPETLNVVVADRNEGNKVYGTTHSYTPAEYPAAYTITLTLLFDNELYGFGGRNLGSGMAPEPDSAVRRIEIGDNVLFNNYAFQGLYKLQSIAWGANAIHRNMFYRNHRLKHLTIGGSVAEYGVADCFTLESVAATYNSTLTQYGVFYRCLSLKTAGVFPNCTAVPSSAFCECYRLTNIGFPNCTSIGDNAFAACCLLNDFFPAETIGNYAFSKNYERLRITIPNTVSLIGSNVCIDNYVLKEIDMTDFTDPNALPRLTSSFPFPLANEGFIVYVANEAMKTAFSNATNWSSAADLYVVKED